MHDGSRRMADDWLAAQLNAYGLGLTNSLTITWDEDDYNQDKDSTILYGRTAYGIVAAGTWTHHNMLRRLEMTAPRLMRAPPRRRVRSSGLSPRIP